jgi:hypothetical protein
LRAMQLTEPLPIRIVPALNTRWRGAARLSGTYSRKVIRRPWVQPNLSRDDSHLTQASGLL